IKKAKIILACGGAFVGDHAYDSLEKRNIANRAVKQMRKIIFGILKSAAPYTDIKNSKNNGAIKCHAKIFTAATLTRSRAFTV
ncbi:MAG: hypothetical protein IJL89_07050, partial [Firmicutes bacterium]|nr:hypothetical protein [Bacillota bacterium]